MSTIAVMRIDSPETTIEGFVYEMAGRSRLGGSAVKKTRGFDIAGGGLALGCERKGGMGGPSSRGLRYNKITDLGLGDVGLRRRRLFSVGTIFPDGFEVGVGSRRCHADTNEFYYIQQLGGRQPHLTTA